MTNTITQMTITPQEHTELISVLSRYDIAVRQIGIQQLKIWEYEQSIISMKSDIVPMIDLSKTLQSEYSELIKTLEAKYGSPLQINIDTGDFTTEAV